MPRSATAVLEESMRRNARNAAFLTAFAILLGAGGLAIDVYAIRNGNAVIGFFGVLIAVTGIAPLRAAAHLRGEDAALAALLAALRENPTTEPALAALRAVAAHAGRPDAAARSAAATATAIEAGIRNGTLTATRDTGVDVRAELLRREPLEAVPPIPLAARITWSAVWPPLNAILARRGARDGSGMPHRREPHRAWWRSTLQALVFRVIADGNRAVTFAVVAVAALVGTVLLALRDVPAPMLWVVAALGVYVLALTAVVAACAALRALSPAELARLVLRTFPTPEAIRVTASRILAHCAAASRILRPLDDLAAPILRDAEDTEPGIVQRRWLPTLAERGAHIEHWLGELRAWLSREERETLRIRALIDALAERLGLEPARLRSHLFACEPELLRQRLVDQGGSWKTIAQAATTDPPPVARILQRLRGFSRLAEEIRECELVQRRTTADANRPIVHWICRIAAPARPGQAEQYARAVASIAAAGLRAIGATPTARDDAVHEAYRQVRTLVRQLTAATLVLPAGDRPHRLCQRLCEPAPARASQTELRIPEDVRALLERALRVVAGTPELEDLPAIERERELEALSRLDVELDRSGSLSPDSAMETSELHRITRRLLLSLGADGETGAAILAVAEAAAGPCGFEVVPTSPLTGAEGLRNAVLASDAFLQVAVEPREPGRRIRSRLALEHGIAIGAGLPVRRIEIDPEEDDWEPLVRDCVAELTRPG